MLARPHSIPAKAGIFAVFLFAVFLAGCGGGVNILPEPFTRERADGKIPVKTDLIREQIRAELDGVPEGESEVARWQAIETDYNACRLSSAESSKAKAEEVFANCMSERGYVYMLPIDAEQFHNDIAFELEKEHNDRLAAERKAEEERIAAEKKAAEEAERKAKGEQYNGALLAAANVGNLELVRKWLSAGANSHAANNDGATALILAGQEGYPEVAEMLLSAGANPNAADKYGQTALYLAVGFGHSEVVKVLLSAGANPNLARKGGATALHFAAEKGPAEVVKMLLSAGANPHAAKDDGRTALHEGMASGHSEVVKVLLSAGANPNAAKDDGLTALHYAARYGHAEVAEILLSAGANPNATGDDGWTALYVAALNEHAEVAEILLSAGANPNAADDKGATALHHAARKGHAEVVKILLSAGANPNAADNDDGWTALMAAANKGHAEVVKILLVGGAEVNQRMPEGYTALDIAKYRGFSEIARILELAKLGILPDVQIPKAADSVFANVWRSVVIVRTDGGQGSGVIVRPNVVATNCHVVDGGGNLVVSELSATIRKRDNKRDFCLLNVPGLQGDIAKVRRWNTLTVGENVYGLGAPQGLDLSLSSGIISQLRQGGGERFIQTDAAISPGSSGGGLFDANGNLVGIMTFKIADENVEGIGFAIPADLVLGN